MIVKDWRFQLKNSVKTPDDLINLLPKNNEITSWAKENFKTNALPFSVTPYFVSLMDGTPNCPIFLQVISSNQEMVADSIEMKDPLGEENLKQAPHLVHRYPDRVLFLATDRCASYCRFCTRKRWVGQGPSPMRDQHEEAFRYIESHEEIKEIIFSGGDPLLLSTDRLQELLKRAFSIKHIEFVRIHSRMLSFAPMRVDLELSEMFAKFSPLYIVTHFNHPKEITKTTIEAIKLLQKSGIVVLNQSVLLKGINDDEGILKDLMRTLVKLKIRPYYMHQCDVVTGAAHFRVPLRRSLELMRNLRGHISGLCQPNLVIDIPGGHGKVVMNDTSIIDEDEDFIYLKGYKGGVARYPKN